MKNIFAYTGATGRGYPPFVSINRLENGDVRVSVRGDAEMRRISATDPRGYLAEGPQVEIVVPAAEWPFD